MGDNFFKIMSLSDKNCGIDTLIGLTVKIHVED